MLNKNLVGFTFESNNIRTITNKDSTVWFCAKDICDVLGYTNPRQAIQINCKQKGVCNKDTITCKGIQKLIYINEPNLYRLIIKSHKPEAEAFETWVMEEVLPAIRKHGVYADTEQKLTQLSPEQVHNNLLNLSKKMQAKYPKLNITDSNVLLENQGDTSDLRYWTDVENLGLPIIRVINAKTISQIQVEFSFYGWKKFGQEKKLVTFEKMAEICKGLSSYNKVRKFAFNKMNTQDTEFVKGFTDLKHAKHIATLMQYGINSILTNH